MNFYGDFRNSRTEIRQKKLFRKKDNLRIFQNPKMPKSILGIKTNISDYIISKTLFCEKAHQII